MNKIRRKSLRDIIDQLEELKDALDTLKEEEEEYRDNIPENMQGSERYEIAEAACDNLDSAVDSLDEVISYIEEATA
jgi:molecular chaperone GrpE (heat shock protein)